MRALNKLTATKVKAADPGKYSDGGGLWFHKRADGGGQWFLRVTVHGRRREMGLGSIPTVTLKDAREQAEKWRSLARQGIDPIKERERERREAAKADNTLAHVAKEAFEARKAELKGDGKAGRWFSPLEIHVLPKLGKIPVEDLDQTDIKNTLLPIWHTKADTARKAMNRLGIVIRYAAAMGLDVDIQVTDKAKALLGKSRHVTKHVPSLPWKDVPAFYQSLNEDTVTHLALKLLILTAARSKPVRFAHVDQFQGENWIIPADNMKSQKGKEKAFWVPLSTEAQAVVKAALPHARDGFLFPSVRKGVISDATMARFMERKGMEARPHGFRSSFRTWCSDATDTPREIAETALAHSVGGKVEQSYDRTDHLEKRRILMERWAGHLVGETGEVVRIAK